MLALMQSKLVLGFQRFASERVCSGYPVFALEHGLNPGEISDLRQQLADELSRSRRLDNSLWLCWIVVAAEVGYEFDGDEFWQSFERRFQRWADFGHRHTIRDWFVQFSRKFSGIKPVGKWAEHFSIISWPITHSILPKDLQSNFAELLFNCSHEIACHPEFDATQTGELLRERGPDSKSRFGALLQQVGLIGRLVLALRNEGVQGVTSPIEPATLKRIVVDLESKPFARDKLREARRVICEAAIRQSAYLSGNKGYGTTEIPVPPKVSHRVVPLIVARKSDDHGWSLGVLLPDVKAMLAANNIKVTALDKTRVRIFGMQDTWQPGRALVAFSNAELSIRALPVGQTIVEFERHLPDVYNALVGAITIQENGPWLLRVHADGMARQSLGHQVRAGQLYVLVGRISLSNTITGPLGMKYVRDENANHVYEYQAPLHFDQLHIEALAKAGLGYALGARIDPVGLVPRWHPKSDASIWLPHEEVIVRLSADYPVREFSMTLNGADRTRVPKSHAEDVHVSLGHLTLGHYHVEVSALPMYQTPGLKYQLTDNLVLEVRLPGSVGSAASYPAGFRVDLEPSGAPFDELLAGKAKITIVGPRQRQVDVSLQFYDINGHPASAIKLDGAELPFGKGWLPKTIATLKQDRFSDAIQSSSKVEFIFSAQELGSARVGFSQHIEPIRWRFERRDQCRIVRLVDEADSGDGLKTSRYDLSNPDREVNLSVEDCLAGFEVFAPGALYVACHGKKRYRTLVAPPPLGKMVSLIDLSVPRKFDASSLQPKALIKSINLLRLWNKSDTAGPLAAVYKWQTTQAIERMIAAVVCGPEWLRALESNGESADNAIFGCLVRSPGLILRLRHWFGDSTSNPGDWQKIFAMEVSRYQICNNNHLIQTAFQLAFDPSRLSFDSPATARETFEALAANQSLARAAFFAKLEAGRLSLPTITELVTG